MFSFKLLFFCDFDIKFKNILINIVKKYVKLCIKKIFKAQKGKILLNLIKEV